MRVRVKICGLTTREGVAAAVAAGADALGFVFADSPRRIDTARATELAREVPPFVARVAVFRDPSVDEVLSVIDAIAPDWVQSEPVPWLADTIAGRTRFLPVVHDAPDLVERIERDGVEGLLHLEGPGRGGRGERPDWERAARIAQRVPLVLAGGLTPDNVAAAIALVHPWAVDVASGVELAPGVKSADLIRRFVAAVRGAESMPRPRAHR